MKFQTKISWLLFMAHGVVDFMNSRMLRITQPSRIIKYCVTEPTEDFLHSLHFAPFNIAYTDVQKP